MTKAHVRETTLSPKRPIARMFAKYGLEVHAFGRNNVALLDLDISPEALTPRQTLSQMRKAVLSARETA